MTIKPVEAALLASFGVIYCWGHFRVDRCKLRRGALVPVKRTAGIKNQAELRLWRRTASRSGWQRRMVQWGAIALVMGLTVSCARIRNPLGKASPEKLEAAVPADIANSAFGSEQSRMALAEHLTASGAKLYGTFWCPYCRKQEQMFGAAMAKLPLVECDPQGKNPQTALCQQAGVSGFPSWEVKGKLYPGMRSPAELAHLSGYTGPQDGRPSP
jgi:hypothetical protein